MSEAWSSKSCKCDCDGGESPTEFSSIGTSSSMMRGMDCMPGTATIRLVTVRVRHAKRCELTEREYNAVDLQPLSSLSLLTKKKMSGFVYGIQRKSVYYI